uniref:DH domain-containing protein n=1 Tax=Rhabditophanes sp. KR3021 TaxID=114890 RepID=A0AC35TSJ5_9BILA
MYCAARRDLSIKKFFTPAISIKRSQPVWDLKNSNRRSIVGSKSSDAITSIPEKESSPGTPQELSIANLKAMYIKGSGASGKSSEENTCNDGDKLSNGKEVPRKKRLGETYKLSELDVKKEEMLVRNISELVESEQVFAKDLINLKRQSPHILGPQLRLIAEELHALHHNFVSCLEEARDGLTLVETSGYNFHCRVKDAIMRMCALFINKSNRFKIYSDYSAAYSLWLQKVSNDSSFKEKLKAYNLKENSKCENVESLLIKPIQRILRYPLFLEKIVECCRGETLESKQAKQALERLQELATYINEMQRLREQYGIRLDDFARTNKGYFKEKGMNVDLRELMIFAHVKIHQTSVNGSIKEKEKNAEAVVLVFQTLVLLFIPEKKKDKAHKVIPISECIIIAPKEESVDMSTSQTSNAPTPHLLQIIHTDPNQKHPSVYLLSCTHSEIKSQLLKSLNKAIKMKNVKNTRPISGASQSDRGYESEK